MATFITRLRSGLKQRKENRGAYCWRIPQQKFEMRSAWGARLSSTKTLYLLFNSAVGSLDLSNPIDDGAKAVIPEPEGCRRHSYSGACTTTADEAGVTKNSCIDGFGRLRTVNEPAIGATTTYAYDNLNNLTSVSTTASTAGVAPTNYVGRSFTYSSLRRLTSATNPESAMTSYAYWPGGNLKTRTDARNITTSYSYNAIDQVTSKTYTDSTSSVTYTYYQQTPNKSWLASMQSGSTTYAYTGFDP
jgi:YD repeat-containing protein